MHDSKFESIISDIPEKNWEESLPIGKFRRIELIDFITRPYSFVAKCRVSGEDDCRNVFIKLYRNKSGRSHKDFSKKVARDYEIAHYWYEKFSQSRSFRVVKPVMVLPEKFIFITEESKGKDLFDLVVKEAAYFPSRGTMERLLKYVGNVGAWLRYKKNKLTNVNDRYSLDALTDYMDVRLKILVEDPRRRFPAIYRDKMLAYMEKNKSLVPDHDLLVTTSHSDFNPSNILVENDSVTVLDFGRLVKESYLLDVSKLYFQFLLLTFKPQYRKRVIDQLQRALLEGFGQPEADETLMFRMLIMRNILTHIKGLTRFWETGAKERLYNLWVLNKERQILDTLLSRDG